MGAATGLKDGITDVGAKVGTVAAKGAGAAAKGAGAAAGAAGTAMGSVGSKVKSGAETSAGNGALVLWLTRATYIIASGRVP